MKENHLLDKGILELEGMQFSACHGCLESEKTVPGRFTLDSRACLPLGKAGRPVRS